MVHKKPITGFEPVTSSLLVTRSNQLSYTGMTNAGSNTTDIINTNKILENKTNECLNCSPDILNVSIDISNMLYNQQLFHS